MNNRRILSLCCFATLIDGYDIQAIGLAVPAMAENFREPISEFAAALSGSLVGMAMGALFLAPLADRLGRKKAITAALMIIGLSSFGLVSAQSSWQVAAWRSVTGVGMGAIIPLAVTIASEQVASLQRTFIVTLVAACAGIGSFVAGLAAPLLEAQFGWRGIFIVGALLPCVAAILFLSSQLHDEQEIPTSSSNPMRTFRPLLGEAYCFRTLIIWASMFLSLLATYSLISWLPSLLATAGWSRSEAQHSAAFLALGSILGSLFLAWIADRGFAVAGLASGFIIAAAALALIGTQPEGKLYWNGLLVAIGAGAIGSQLALGSLATSLYPPAIRATALGWASGVGRIGSIFGPLLLVWMIQTNLQPEIIISSLALPMSICGVCMLLIPRALNNKSH